MSIDPIRRWASIICGAAFLLLATWYSVLAVRAENLHLVVVAVVGVLVTLSIGLFMRWRWAGRGAAFVLVLWAIFIPMGVLNPFVSPDFLLQGTIAPLKLLWLIPLEVALLGMVWLVDPATRKPG
jgi:asparagine N-glycosylation enzyme membrane subunit Stt3